MNLSKSWKACWVLVGSLFVASSLQAADAPTTTLTVQGMHCGGCAKKIGTKLQAVAGVEKTSADVKAGLVFVAPKSGQEPSPRSMWEAVETAGYKIVKLEGPGGTFEEKPKS